MFKKPTPGQLRQIVNGSVVVIIERRFTDIKPQVGLRGKGRVWFRGKVRVLLRGKVRVRV